MAIQLIGINSSIGTSFWNGVYLIMDQHVKRLG
jgi:hypothetical protein